MHCHDGIHFLPRRRHWERGLMGVGNRHPNSMPLPENAGGRKEIERQFPHLAGRHRFNVALETPVIRNSQRGLGFVRHFRPMKRL